MEKMICTLTVISVSPYDTSHWCNVFCLTPDNKDVGFVFEDVTDFCVGKVIYATRTKTPTGSYYEILPFWDGKE